MLPPFAEDIKGKGKRKRSNGKNTLLLDAANPNQNTLKLGIASTPPFAPSAKRSGGTG
jgi:hypothetical protein